MCGSFCIYPMKYILFIFFLFYFFSAQAGFEKTPEWLSLVHYRPSVLGGYKSSVDTDNFFLSPNGKTNPEAELNATIELFNGTDTTRQCLFPARYKLLKKNALVSKTFPKCVDLEQFYDDLQPAGITLLFTDAYINNPSSLFGHTLFRIDTKRKGTQLLAHGVNYGAFVGENANGALYVVNGLTGGYYGGYTVKPYYDVINTYNNIENRDIWEYNLNFSDEELDFLVAHLWEIGHTQTRYYFFTKNCSYLLMELLDAVRPSLKLADDFPLQTIPLDTAKAVAKRPGLVRSANYRPSRQSKIMHGYRQMNPLQKQALLTMVEDKKYETTGLTDAEATGVLEISYQYTQYKFVAGKMPLEEYRKESFDHLLARNKIKAENTLPELKEGQNPLYAHESKRLTVGAGVRNGYAFEEITFRPAYHSLTDNAWGLRKGAEINFLSTSVRHYHENNKTVLHRFDILGIQSLAPSSALFKPISFGLNVDVARTQNPKTMDEGYTANFKVGGGTTFELTQSVYAYIMLNNYASYGGFLPDNAWVGMGPAVGVLATFDRLSVQAQIEKIFATSYMGDQIKYRLDGGYTLCRNLGLFVRYQYDQNRGRDFNETSGGLKFFF